MWHPSGSASFAWQAWENVHCQGVGCTPWRPSGPASFAWQEWDNVHCQGVGCTPCSSGSASFAWQAWQCALPRGRMYALASLGLRLFCVAGMGQCALPRGRMYGVASLGLRLFLRLLRGRRGTMCTAKGSDVRPGVPRAPSFFRSRCGAMCIACGICVAGLGHCAQTHCTHTHSLLLIFNH